jgi:hypothetical protein
MRTMLAATVALTIILGSASGCSRPSLPSAVGPGKFRDITQVRKGMSANEVERVMGKNYKSVFEEGILGADGGNYTWEYPEGRVYFNMDGVVRVIPNY